ncbi:hypothetical protein DASC09_042280 [Saccharomycopsis crataegensis]|uniref:Peptidase M24 domain-containing protein n=1 Tax=Saccharomycopsis crataegensis TaxID=43959 RepID=A0AAV5QPR5_9ASCO|nr:hypothetical protein DASC09_042280 [Saccharomycopsis crataegensis]
MSTEAAAPDYTINNPAVVTKYKTAGEISVKVLQEVKKLAVPGATIYELCKFGDELLLEETSKIYNSKKSKVESKGIGFPTCVSPNNIAEYLSPASADDKAANLTLKEGDVVSIQLGAQIDGYVASAGETVVVGAEKITGRAADVIAAAYYATEAAIRTIKEEKKNFDVTKVVGEIAKAYETTPLEGMLSYSQQRNVALGEKEIIINPSETQKNQVASLNFKNGDVFGLDILISSSKDGKAKPTDIKTTLYKLTGNNYSLKLKSSHAALAEVKSHSANFPVTTREFKEPTKGRMGLQECVNHNVMTAYDVVSEKEGEIIAQFFSTVALTSTGVLKLAYPEFDISKVESSHKIEDQAILDLLKQPLKAKKAKKAKSAN